MFFVASAGNAATISGILIDTATSLPISGQKVYFLDSLSSTSLYRDSTVTNSAGSYTFTIPAASPWGNLVLSTMTCGGMSSKYHYYSGSSIVAPNWGIATAYYAFSGTVYYRNKVPAAGVNVYVAQLGSSPAAPVVNAAGANAVTAANGTYTVYLPCSWSAGWISLEFENPYCLSGWSGLSWSGASAAGRVDCYDSTK